MEKKEINTAGEFISLFKKNRKYRNVTFSIVNEFIENVGQFMYIQAASSETILTGRFVVGTGEMYQSDETINKHPVIIHAVKCDNKQHGKQLLLEILKESFPKDFDFEYGNPLKQIPQSPEINGLILKAYTDAFKHF